MGFTHPVNIIGRHIVETGVQSGLSRDAVNRLYEERQDTSEHIVEAAFNRLPEVLIASVDGARLGL